MNVVLVCYHNAIYITDNAMYTFVYVTLKLKKIEYNKQSRKMSKSC